MKYVVYGAGAVGGVLAARLHQAGAQVVAVARGDHLDAWRRRGLRVHDPDHVEDVDVPVVGDIAHAGVDADDVVVLSMKSQHTWAALQELQACAPDSVAVACAQNGVANESMTLRLFARVYGMYVMVPATFVSAGVVHAISAPVTGILDVGRFPAGVDEVTSTISDDLNRAHFDSRPVDEIQRWKYAKLLMNISTTVEAVCGNDPGWRQLAERATDEARAVLVGAGIDVAGPDEERRRLDRTLSARPRGDGVLSGGSVWQSLARGTGSVETDFINGEVALLGRLHGVPTPLNAAVQRAASRLARLRTADGFTVGEVLGTA